jgi:hypothetical protein
MPSLPYSSLEKLFEEEIKEEDVIDICQTFFEF